MAIAFLAGAGLYQRCFLRRAMAYSKQVRHIQSYATAALQSNDIRHSGIFLRSQWHSAIDRSKSLIAIDGTAGRGSDTIALGEYLGSGGEIHAFDIQSAAIAETADRYKRIAEIKPMADLHLHEQSHADFSSLQLPENSVAVVAYNLGWYPGQDTDRSVITKKDATISSLSSAENLVAIGGLISVMAYVGHPGGKEEESAVVEWARGLCRRTWSVVLVSYPNRGGAPSLLLCERIL